MSRNWTRFSERKLGLLAQQTLVMPVILVRIVMLVPSSGFTFYWCGGGNRVQYVCIATQGWCHPGRVRGLDLGARGGVGTSLMPLAPVNRWPPDYWDIMMIYRPRVIITISNTPWDIHWLSWLTRSFLKPLFATGPAQPRPPTHHMISRASYMTQMQT